jgi:hypothetical protein
LIIEMNSNIHYEKLIVQKVDEMPDWQVSKRASN